MQQFEKYVSGTNQRASGIPPDHGLPVDLVKYPKVGSTRLDLHDLDVCTTCLADAAAMSAIDAGKHAFVALAQIDEYNILFMSQRKCLTDQSALMILHEGMKAGKFTGQILGVAPGGEGLSEALIECVSHRGIISAAQWTAITVRIGNIPIRCSVGCISKKR